MSEPGPDDAVPPRAVAPPGRGATLGLGIYGERETGGLSAVDVIAIALTLVWLAGVAVFFVLLEPGAPAGTVPLGLTLLAAFLPIALIWVAATSARMILSLRDETRRLKTAVDAMRHSYLAQSQTAAAGLRPDALRADALRPAGLPPDALPPDVARRIDELAAAQRRTDAAVAMFTSRRDPARVAPSADGSDAQPVAAPDAGDEQPGLALGTPAEALRPPVGAETFIRAMNFPETAEDRDGFRAMRRALEDPVAGRLVRAAQDILTLLSEDGIYMDDLHPDRARPDVWRRFAGGERGRAIAGLGGIRDRSALSLAAGRMRQDTIFRDAAHHFLRTFDRVFAGFEKSATDLEIAGFAETRTARGFMLIGRVAGTFD